MIRSKELAKSIYEISKKEKLPASFFEALISELENRGLSYLLPSLEKRLRFYVDRDKNLSKLKVSFAKEPSKSSIENVQKFVGVTKDEVETDIDEGLLGGFIAEYDGKIYDGSLKRWIANLKKELQEI